MGVAGTWADVLATAIDDLVEVERGPAQDTADTLLVLGSQAGEWIPRRRWAWTLGDEHGWRRISGGLDGVVDYGLVSDGRRFLATGGLLGEDAIDEGRLITSTDGRRWEARGVLSDADRLASIGLADRLGPAHDVRSVQLPGNGGGRGCRGFLEDEPNDFGFMGNDFEPVGCLRAPRSSRALR